MRKRNISVSERHSSQRDFLVKKVFYERKRYFSEGKRHFSERKVSISFVLQFEAAFQLATGSARLKWHPHLNWHWLLVSLFSYDHFYAYFLTFMIELPLVLQNCNTIINLLKIIFKESMFV